MDELTAALLAVADDPTALDRLTDLADSGDLEAVAESYTAAEYDTLSEADRSGLVPRRIIVQGKSGPYAQTVYVRATEPQADGDLSTMSRRDLQKLAMEVGAKTSLKMDEPKESLIASITAKIAADQNAGGQTSTTAATGTTAKPGYVDSLSPEQAKAGRDRVIAARADAKLGDDTNKITDERFAAVADDLLAAVTDHAKTMPDPNVGPPVAKLYATVGPKHGLTPDEFRGAVQRLQKAGRVRTSGMSKSLGDEPRPDLLIVPQSGTPQAWVHPPAQK